MELVGCRPSRSPHESKAPSIKDGVKVRLGLGRVGFKKDVVMRGKDELYKFGPRELSYSD